MTAPKPFDHRAVADPKQIDEQLNRILSEPADNLADEFRRLELAHDVLRNVLQEN